MTKALIVVTSTAKFGSRMQATGVWLSEAAHFHAVMKAHDIAVDYVSPEGGYVPLDPGSLLPDNLDPTSWEFYSDASYRQHYLAEALKPSDVQPDDYDLIYFAGGHGTMWDFPENKALAAIAQQIYANGGLVTAVCHGVVGLLPMTTATGAAFIKGRKLTGFTNEEEAINKLTDAVPFLAEDALREAGSDYSKAAPYTEHVVVDGRLITGQNPQSARAIALKVVEQLNK